MDDVSIQLLNRFRQGDENAAEEIFQRYMNRLLALAQTRISRKLQLRVDAEDVVQSVYHSFYRRAREGQFELKRSGDLWRLLAAITVNKVCHQARFHGQKKRSTNREQSLANDGDVVSQNVDLFTYEPDTEDAVAILDELSYVMNDLSELQCKMLELRLQDHDLEEIAESVGRSQRTVRRTFDEVRERLERRLLDITNK